MHGNLGMKRAFAAGLIITILCFSMLIFFSRAGLANAEQSPVISSVSPISPSLLQNITIQGSGFGNVQPQLSRLGDGSVDTVWGGSTPSMVVYDKSNLLSAGADGAWSGFTNGPPDLIGVILLNWTNTQIVLGGFGSGLDSQFSWNQVLPGDALQIQIQTVSGLATYNALAVSNQPNSNSNSTALLTPLLDLFCQSSTTFSTFRAEISGNLTYNGTGLQSVPVLLSYSVDEGNSWNELTTVCTANDGNFLAVWLPPVTGNYQLKAEWAGDTNYTETSTVINFAVLPFGEQSVFSVTSNSTISGLSFNSTSGELDFTVSGPEGGTGYCYVYIPKSLINDVSNFSVFIDGKTISYSVESLGDTWLISFSYQTYQTNANQVKMGTNAADPIVVNGSQFAQWAPYGVIIVLIAIFVVLLAV